MDDESKNKAMGQERDSFKKLVPTEIFMKDLATAMDSVLNEEGKPKQNGFILFVFPIGAEQANYISNCHRDDMISFLKEFIARNEGKSLHPAPGAVQ